jgi:3-phosphoshikimate 1-carboxyvinyltransferase
MTTLLIRPAARLQGTIRVPSDKSISHRALILGMLAQGRSTVRNWLAAGDTLATLVAVEVLGIEVEREGDTLSFEGGNLREPSQPIDCANAGTAMRLLSGVLSGQPFPSVLDGSEQLRRRPMGRIVDPLRRMGAYIAASDGRAPLTICPAALKGMTYPSPVASAQVKSAILLAGLFAEGATTIIEPGPSRDHTERMLRAMGASLTVKGWQVSLIPPDHAPLSSLDLTVPGDMSSAAFLIVAAALVGGSEVRITGVGLNPTRTGLLDILRQMGAAITIEDEDVQGGEPVGTLRVRGGDLSAVEVGGEVVVRAIDEFPILTVAATQANGETVIRDAAELRVKEVDRISLVAQELGKLGAEIEETPDGMIINGPVRLRGAAVSSHGDHRLGMALAVAGLVAEGETQILDADCIADSFPGFAETLVQLGAEVN